MGEISEEGKEQPLIGADPFGLTENDVLRVIAEVKDDVDSSRSALEDSRGDLKRLAEALLPRDERNLQALSRLFPGEILTKIKTCYDRVVEFTDAGLPEREIITRIMAEFPDLMAYQPILEKKAWGHRLARAIMLAPMESGD